MPYPVLEPHDPLADDPKSNPGLSRAKALWIIAILFGLVMGGFWTYARAFASHTCEQVKQIHAASNGGRDLPAARREASARGLEFSAEEASDGTDRTRVRLSRSGRPVGSWTTGADASDPRPECIRSGRYF